MLKIVFMSIYIVLSSAQAENCDPSSKATCCDILKQQNKSKISRRQTYDKLSCSLSVVTEVANRSFRRFGFASDGQVSVFMQPGGDTQRAHSTQSFLIYPFDENPSLNLNTGNQFEINSGSGQIWTFNSLTSLPISVEDCDITVSPQFSLQNSGVEITSCKKHLVIETPVEASGEYISYPDKPLTIRDPKQKSCTIKTTDLYRYIKKSTAYQDRLGRYYDIKFKFATNRELGLRLKQLCPSIDVSMLMETRPAFHLDLEGLVDPVTETDEEN